MQTDTSPNRQTVRLMLVEDDPIFRAGVILCLGSFTDVQIVLEADNDTEARQMLHDRLEDTPIATAVWTPGMAESIPDIIVMSADLGAPGERPEVALALCREFRTRYPRLPILLLGSAATTATLTTAQRLGVAGFQPKGQDPTELVNAIRRVATGQTLWATAPTGTTVATPAVTPTGNPTNLSAWMVLRRNLRLSGLQQIDAKLAEINAQLEFPELSVLDELVLTGRRRELRAARWMVQQLLSSRDEGRSFPRDRAASPLENRPLTPTPPPPPSPPAATSPASAPTAAGELAQAPSTSIRAIQAVLFDQTTQKLQSPLYNLTNQPLEIDILKAEKKRELLYTILRKVETLLDELRFSQVSAEQLAAKELTLLTDLWRETVTDFFGKYATIALDDRPVEIVSVLLEDDAIVTGAILAKIPYTQNFLSHILFQTPLQIDDRTYGLGTVEAVARMELLLHHLMVQVANAVVQPLLNRFGNLEPIKQAFYDKRLLSTREIERFRNNLSWKYRMNRYFREPTAIFESRHQLFSFTDSGITTASIYAPRNDELAQLNGVQLAVTLSLEARDAIAPRLQAVLSFVGSGVVYLLTDVVGRGIGLIGRGIVKGIGNAIQDVRFSRDSSRSR